jgi:formate hydrogenlyase transcriptional activator
MSRNVYWIDDQRPSAANDNARPLTISRDHARPGQLERQCDNEIVGHSPTLQRLLQQASIVARTHTSVLILGESGTGKELVARLIHRQSARREQPFVGLNCAAIPSGLLESELFGHERGAFTGAISQRVGRFEAADHGTLFLDEIGDIPAELQPKLLRVLQDHEFERLGSTRTIRADVRVVAATHRNLSQMVEVAAFRADLYYRLNVFPLQMPALRERREDVAPLVWYFVGKYCQRLSKCIETIPSDVMQRLAQHDWPGNIRELQNFIERAVILSTGAVLEAPVWELTSHEETAAEPVTLRDAEKFHIMRILRQVDGVVSAAAARLGVPRTTLFYKMRRLGINHPRTAFAQMRGGQSR